MLLLPDGPFTDLLNEPAGALSIFGSSLITSIVWSGLIGCSIIFKLDYLSERGGEEG